MDGSSYIIPAFRVPVLTEENEHEWVIQGSDLWEVTAHSSGTGVVLEVSAGLKRLQMARIHLAETLAQATLQSHRRSPNNELVQAIQHAMNEYARLLQKCRQEMSEVLLPDNQQQEPSSSTSSSTSSNPDMEEQIASLERQVLLLPWSNDLQQDQILIRPPPSNQNHRPSTASSRLWELINSWELSHLHYNMAVLEIHTALAACRENTRESWKRAGTHWQRAASWMPTDYWRDWLVAEAQRAAYQYVALAARPNALMMAKLASGCVPLFAKAVETGETETAMSNGSGGDMTTNLQVWKCWHICFQAVSEFHQASMHATRKQWPTACARVHRAYSKGRRGQELFHSLMAEYGTFEIESNTSIPPDFLHDLQALIHLLWPQMRELKEALMEQTQRVDRSLDSSLPDIPPQSLVKLTDPSLPLLVEGGDNNDDDGPLFETLNDAAARYRTLFQNDLQHILQQTTQTADGKTEQARQTLAKADLPHGLTRYQQQQKQRALQNNSSGEPAHSSVAASASSGEILWRRIQHIQYEGVNNSSSGGESGFDDVGLTELQQGLWELRDNAERAHVLINETKSQLDENVRLDNEFREANPRYESKHASTVEEIQASFWQSLRKYEELLHSAASGDEVLFEKLENLPTDSKFQYLTKLTQSELERLLASAAPDFASDDFTTGDKLRRPSHSAELERVAESLNQGLLDLSNLFLTREELVTVQLPQEMQASLQIATEQLMSLPIPETEEEQAASFEQIIQKVQPPMQQILDEIGSNLSQQTALLKGILKLNESFRILKEEQEVECPPVAAARSASSPSSAAESTLSTIYEALDEMEKLTHLWRQGASFYETMTPKLVKFQQQVSDVSTRLAVERFEFGDAAARDEQEAKDAAMAAELAEAIAEEDTGSQGDEPQSPRTLRNPSRKQEEFNRLNGLRPAEGVELEIERPQLAYNEVSDLSMGSLHNQGTSSNVQNLQPLRRNTSRNESVSSQRSNGQSDSNNSNPSALIENIAEEEQQSSTDEVVVDDEALASLIAMEFDPEKVAAALKKHDNNVESALNDLLGS